MSIWFRVENLTALKTAANIIKCYGISGGSLPYIDMQMVKDSSNSTYSMKVLFGNSANLLSQDMTSNGIDGKGWNHLAIYVDQASTLKLAINRNIMATKQLTSSNLISSV